MRRVGVFGWGIVAPRSPNIEAFARNLERPGTWLEPFGGFGPDNFLVGRPEFSFQTYRPWIEERFKPNRFTQLESKMGRPVQYAIGAFIQSLEQNPGLEAELRELGEKTHIYVGTGLGDLGTQYGESVRLYRAQRCWDRFWSKPERNSALAAFLEGDVTPEGEAPPPSPEGADKEVLDLVEDTWWSYWAARSDGLAEYLREQREIEAISVEGDVEAGKLAAMKEKRRRLRRLQQKWGAPEPPWQAVSANLIWNIDNIPAAQISMLGQLTGAAVAPGAACATFGVTLRMALDAIRSGKATAAVIGATDPPPHPLTVGAFYSARVIAADAQVSKPLTQLRGTHVAGGSVIWIVADLEHMEARGFRPLGMEPVSVGVTSDADHIITPSKEGPSESIRLAIEEACSEGEKIVAWDLHATATPGDFNEVELVRAQLPEDVLVSARKGTFGHGMAAGGGWELTAQYLGFQERKVYPTTLAREELNREIAGVHRHFAYDTASPAPEGLVGKLSMGIGGINSCIVSRPLPDP